MSSAANMISIINLFSHKSRAYNYGKNNFYYSQISEIKLGLTGMQRVPTQPNQVYYLKRENRQKIIHKLFEVPADIFGHKGHLTRPEEIKLKIKKNDCNKCFHGSQRSGDAYPPLIYNPNNRQINIRFLCVHNIKDIKYILDHIMKTHDIVYKHIEIFYIDIDMNNNNIKELFLEIFKNTTIYTVDDFGPSYLDSFKFGCVFQVLCNMNYDIESVLYEDSNQKFALSDRCNKFESECTTFSVFNNILSENRHIETFYTDKLIMNMEHSNTSKKSISMGFPYEIRPINSLKSLYIGEIIHNGRFSDNFAIKPYDVFSVLACHSQSLESITISGSVGATVWESMCTSDIVWPNLKSITIGAVEIGHVYQHPTQLVFPKLIIFQISGMDQRMIQPTPKTMCTVDKQIYDSVCENIYYLTERNKRNNSARVTWLIISENYMKHYRINKDIRLMIANMLIDYSNPQFVDAPLKSSKVKLPKAWYLFYANKCVKCKLLIAISPHQLKIWNQIKEAEIESITSKQNAITSNDEVAQILQDIESATTTLNAAQEILTIYKNALSRKRERSNNTQKEANEKQLKYDQSFTQVTYARQYSEVVSEFMSAKSSN